MSSCLLDIDEKKYELAKEIGIESGALCRDGYGTLINYQDNDLINRAFILAELKINEPLFDIFNGDLDDLNQTLEMVLWDTTSVSTIEEIMSKD